MLVIDTIRGPTIIVPATMNRIHCLGSYCRDNQCLGSQCPGTDRGAAGGRGEGRVYILYRAEPRLGHVSQLKTKNTKPPKLHFSNSPFSGN